MFELTPNFKHRHFYCITKGFQTLDERLTHGTTVKKCNNE